MPALKLIITSKGNLKAKYGTKFSSIQSLFTKLIKSDKAKQLTTKIVYVDDAASAKKFGVVAIAPVDEKNCKNIFDALHTKHQPAYMVIFGAQDIFPLQQLTNDLFDPDPDGDNDRTVPSDLPYASNSPFSKKISSFINPARVVGRIPDVPHQPDVAYVTSLINDIVKYKPLPREDFMNYFAVTAFVWENSTQQSIQNIFGNFTKLLDSPPAHGGYTKTQLSALSHFYNCHGALADTNYFGQKGASFPVALASPDLTNKITYGAVAAAECCYGIQLLDPNEVGGMSIANNYLFNHAISFMGSSTIAYGPAVGQGLADLICQYFMKGVHEGASTGRALLEARHKFLNVNGPTLDAHEQKTLAQFYILGDPSITPVKTQQLKTAMSTIENRRMNLETKGMTIGQSIAPAEKMKTVVKSKNEGELSKVLKETGFTRSEKQFVFETKEGGRGMLGMKKAFLEAHTRFHTFQKVGPTRNGVKDIKVLVVKENDEQVLGWKVYQAR